MRFFGKPSRRQILKSSGITVAPIAALAQICPAFAAPNLPSYEANQNDNLFTRIGVRPLINARGTYTIISGSRSLPQVKQAMFEASHYYVHLDEMMEAIGAELAKLTGADWGIVTNGCEAAIVLATVACIAGANVEQCQALPYVKMRDQVIVPKHSRNPYDVGLRVVGAQIVEVDTAEGLEAAISPRTAMIYVMSGPPAAKGPLSIANICKLATQRDVPVFIDAAAEEPVRPNIHLAAGATLVGYSGGKCLRGPQSSGMLIGRRDLCRAAYFQAAPHHCYGRALKCSKEESMGLLAAVRQWYQRDHESEQRMWRGWLENIELRLKSLPSTQFQYLEPVDLSNRAPRLRIQWDATVLGITGTELAIELNGGMPRILLESATGVRPDQMQSAVTIMPYMMDPGEDRIVSDALYQVLARPKHYSNPSVPAGPPHSVAGPWAVSIAYIRGIGEQQFAIQQQDHTLSGIHRGEIYESALRGTVHADQIEIQSRMAVPGNVIEWDFQGAVQGDRMAGLVDMGEYGKAGWTAQKI